MSRRYANKRSPQEIGAHLEYKKLAQAIFKHAKLDNSWYQRYRQAQALMELDLEKKPETMSQVEKSVAEANVRRVRAILGEKGIRWNVG